VGRPGILPRVSCRRQGSSSGIRQRLVTVKRRRASDRNKGKKAWGSSRACSRSRRAPCAGQAADSLVEHAQGKAGSLSAIPARDAVFSCLYAVVSAGSCGKVFADPAAGGAKINKKWCALDRTDPPPFMHLSP
jgi:hypothetical protein